MHKRLLTLSIAFFLTACIDSGGLQIVDGIGGTGISTGRITAFGSVYVNGVKYETDNATFTRDGISNKTQDDFNIGEIVKVIGTINEDKKTGTAQQVIYSDVLEGPVTQVAGNTNSNTLEIMGQKIVTNDLTVLHGFSKLTDLTLDNIVEVSGFQTQDQITATSIKLIQSSYTDGSLIEVEGFIDSIDSNHQTLEIGNLTIDFSTAQLDGLTANDLVVDQIIQIYADQDISDNKLIASRIAFPSNTLETNASYEVEGIVTRFASITDFDIDGSGVITTTDTIYQNGDSTSLALDALILVRGTVDAQGRLVAEEIAFMDFSSEVILEANIESIDTANNSVTLLGQTITLNAFTLLNDETGIIDEHLNSSDLAIGDSVFITAYQHDIEGFIATRLSKVQSTSDVFISAVVSEVHSGLGTLTLFDNSISTDVSTRYFDINDTSITQAELFDLLIEGSTSLHITGTTTTPGAILANDIRIASE